MLIHEIECEESNHGGHCNSHLRMIPLIREFSVNGKRNAKTFSFSEQATAKFKLGH